MSATKPTKKSLSVTNPELVEEWDYNKNAPLLPNCITSGVGKKVWWKCSKGHEWEATVLSRSRGNGCPYCSGLYAIVGETDLATIRPDLLNEWDYEKNSSISPHDITAGSGKKVWWKCSKGHSWETSICYVAKIRNERKSSCCPYCSGQKVLAGYNDLATIKPELAKEWNYERNKDFTPDTVAKTSHIKVWWKCSNGHEWEAFISYRSSGSGCPICSNRQLLQGVNDLSTTNPELAKEWDYDKNGNLQPTGFTPTSQQKVFWKCSVCGNSWESKISSRVHGSGCLFCSGKIVEQGINDLASQRPDVANEWNYEKNDSLKPTNVTVGSGKKVWWKCSLGHEWNSPIYDRTKGNGCPICSGRQVLAGFNDLATLRPDLAKEWNKEKNNGLLASEVTVGSKKKVWWKCSKGHEWQADICCRSNGTGCPYCSGRKVLIGYNDLASLKPDISIEWDYEKNGDLKPTAVTVNSPRKVWWKCSEGHCWEAIIQSRTRENCGCPYCSGHRVIEGKTDLATSRPDLIQEWDYEKNKDLKDRFGKDISTPDKVSTSSNQCVWWKCSYGHSWKTRINMRTSQNTGCPLCKKSGTSIPEQGIAFYLSKITEVEQRVNIGGKEVDIYLPKYKTGIEYDGIFYHKNKKELDAKKDLVLTDNGIVLYRLIESNISEQIDNHIYFIESGSYANYDQALRDLCVLLSDNTGNKEFQFLDINLKRDRLKIREKLDLYEKENSLAAKCPQLSKEWDYNKNGKLTPEMFYSASGERVWWKCSHGHSWQAVISSRSSGGKNCPYCAGLLVIPGQNDLATLYPQLAKEWDYEKNGKLRPLDITSKTPKKVWWKCSTCNNSWLSSVAHRTDGRGCPYCKGKSVMPGFNDIATLKPELADEWDYEKNGTLKPTELTLGSGKKVWWKCSKGHSWEAAIYNRSVGKGCPYCINQKTWTGYNDLATLRPDLINEWDYEKNQKLTAKNGCDISTPDKVNPGSNYKVWWKCSVCGNSWQSLISNRAKLNSGCPECSKIKISRALSKKILCVETDTIYLSCKDAQEQTGIDSKLINRCCYGKAKSAGGYHWKYTD